MITVEIRKSNGEYVGFSSKGHAGYAEEGYDIILCAPVSTDTVVELKASAKGLPIVFFNSCPSDKQLKEYFYVYAGSDEEVAGEYQAEYILEKFKTKTEINIVIIGGSKGHSATTGRTNGIKKALSQRGKTINYVFEDYADWDTKKAYDLFSIFLKNKLKEKEPISNNKFKKMSIYRKFKKDEQTYVIIGWKSVCWPVSNKSIKILETVLQEFKGLNIPFQYVLLNEDRLTDIRILEFYENDSNVNIFSIERKIKIKI